jgi:predicted kinase
LVSAHPEPESPVASHVVLTCGVAGSGKTAYAKSLERLGYERLSIDEQIWREHGRDGASFPPDEYERMKSDAEAVLLDRLLILIGEGRLAVLEYSFWSREKRDRYKAIIESHGATWELVYLKASPALLRERLAARNGSGGANSVTVSGDLLDRYLEGFEEPIGEGEFVIEQH